MNLNTKILEENTIVISILTVCVNVENVFLVELFCDSKYIGPDQLTKHSLFCLFRSSKSILPNLNLPLALNNPQSRDKERLYRTFFGTNIRRWRASLGMYII